MNADSPPAADEPSWVPFQRHNDLYRVKVTSCCCQYELVSQGGQYLILRPAPGGGYEETARGIYRATIGVWDRLIIEHAGHHRHQPR
ncbi:hypothetical protein [Nonomuraea lactucae]|uniref:hypothetical protein n=1 Tax=Nonomuraea lactucae TaxID=2249762 RepID=UPI000DE5207B|nr:hypothetical protein [Nonomuraea lactucae]